MSPLLVLCFFAARVFFWALCCALLAPLSVATADKRKRPCCSNRGHTLLRVDSTLSLSHAPSEQLAPLCTRAAQTVPAAARLVHGACTAAARFVHGACTAAARFVYGACTAAVQPDTDSLHGTGARLMHRIDAISPSQACLRASVVHVSYKNFVPKPPDPYKKSRLVSACIQLYSSRYKIFQGHGLSPTVLSARSPVQ